MQAWTGNALPARRRAQHGPLKNGYARPMPINALARPLAVRTPFASDAHAPGAMLGVAAAGIAPGCALSELRPNAWRALRQLAGTGVPVFVQREVAEPSDLGGRLT